MLKLRIAVFDLALPISARRLVSAGKLGDLSGEFLGPALEFLEAALKFRDPALQFSTARPFLGHGGDLLRKIAGRGEQAVDRMAVAIRAAADGRQGHVAGDTDQVEGAREAGCGLNDLTVTVVIASPRVGAIEWHGDRAENAALTQDTLMHEQGAELLLQLRQRGASAT